MARPQTTGRVRTMQKEKQLDLKEIQEADRAWWFGGCQECGSGVEHNTQTSGSATRQGMPFTEKGQVKRQSFGQIKFEMPMK